MQGAEVYCPVDNAGRFTSEVEGFAGQSVFEANDQIVDFLRANGALVFTNAVAPALRDTLHRRFSASVAELDAVHLRR
jgi:valyl-tRNA synthetase